MQEKTHYKNGQPIYIIEQNHMTYFYQNGVKKAEGPYLNEMMEGEWRFYDQSGRLLQIGHLLHHEKHGSWIRYDEEGTIIYSETFVNGKQQKKQ